MVPFTEEFFRQVVREVLSGKTPIFYTGKTGNISSWDVAQKIAGANCNKYVTIDQILDQFDIEMPFYDSTNPVTQKPWEQASRILAEEAKGDPLVVKGRDLRPNSVFETVELPALQENEKINSLTSIEPETMEESPVIQKTTKVETTTKVEEETKVEEKVETKEEVDEEGNVTQTQEVKQEVSTETKTTTETTETTEYDYYNGIF